MTREARAGETEALRGAGSATGALPRMLTITLPLPDPLLTINARRRMHPMAQARHTRRQREDAMLAAYAALSAAPGTLRGVMFDGWVRADVQVFRRPRQKVPDEGAQWEFLKPVFDGFESAGVVANDKQITHGDMVWHRTDPEPRVEITLTEVR